MGFGTVPSNASLSLLPPLSLELGVEALSSNGTTFQTMQCIQTNTIMYGEGQCATVLELGYCNTLTAFTGFFSFSTCVKYSVELYGDLGLILYLKQLANKLQAVTNLILIKSSYQTI